MVDRPVPSERFATSNDRVSETHQPALISPSVSSRTLGPTNVLMIVAVESTATRTFETQFKGYEILSLPA